MTTPPEPQATGEPQPTGQPEPTGRPQPTGGKPRSVGRSIGTVIACLVVIGLLAGLARFLTRDEAMNANVGDCLHQEGSSDNLKIVKCDSADANFTVLGKVGGKGQYEATGPFTQVCNQWQDTTNTYWQGEQGKKGDVLCLKKK